MGIGRWALALLLAAGPAIAGPAAAEDCFACALAPEITATADIDSDATGGDGIAGVVIGIANVRDSVVNTVNRTDHSAVDGGDAQTINTARLTAGARISISGAPAVSTSVSGGDGLVGLVVEVEEALPAPGPRHDSTSPRSEGPPPDVVFAAPPPGPDPPQPDAEPSFDAVP